MALWLCGSAALWSSLCVVSVVVLIVINTNIIANFVGNFVQRLTSVLKLVIKLLTTGTLCTSLTRGLYPAIASSVAITRVLSFVVV